MHSLIRNVLIVVMLAASCMAQAQGNSNKPAPCSEAQQKQFDFWVGSWNLTWPGNSAGEVAHGTNNITRILDGCVVEENFSGGDAMSLRGMSVSLFNTRSGKWQQTWVDNEGAYLDFVGELKMVK